MMSSLRSYIWGAHIKSIRGAFWKLEFESYPGNLSIAAESLRIPNVIYFLWSKNSIVFSLFLCIIIFIFPRTLTREKGAISELSVQCLYLHSPNAGVSQDLTLCRQFFQRPNVINGCHLRRVGWGLGGKKVIQKRLLLKKRCSAGSSSARI